MGDTAAATATTACGSACISSTGIGGSCARCLRHGTAPRLQLNRTTPLCAQRAHAQLPRSRRAGPARRESRRESAAAAPAAATGLQNALTRRTAQRTHRARPHSAAASSSAARARHHARPTTNDDKKMPRARKDTTPERDAGRWSVGHGRTWPPPRQRGVLLPPPMRAWLAPPHGLVTRPCPSLAL